MLGGMDPWITVPELAIWAREEIDPADEFASMVVKAATIVVSEATGYHDTDREFTIVTAPDRLKVIVAQVAKRSYLNPDQIVREGNIGPIGGDAYAAAYAAGLSLTDEELAEVQRVVRRTGGRTGKGLKVLGFRVAHNGRYGRDGTYAPDTPAPGAAFGAGSDWMIPVD